MSAKIMFEVLDRKPENVREIHHGNKRKQRAEMKIKARRAERKKLNKECLT